MDSVFEPLVSHWFSLLQFHFKKNHQGSQIPEAAPLAGFGLFQHVAPRGGRLLDFAWLLPQAQHEHLVTRVPAGWVQWVSFSYLIRL